jgi:ribosomal-protein-alanine N-acetyltransferase
VAGLENVSGADKNIESALKASDLTLRAMLDEDLPQVLIIERGAQASPWSRLSFEESISREHCCRVIASQVDDCKESIVAYHIVCPVADELHILNVVAAKQCQGNGLGHMLMSDIVDLAQQQSLNKIFLEVRASNLAAQSLYLKWQFVQIAVRKSYYGATSLSNGAREDALVFLRQL